MGSPQTVNGKFSAVSLADKTKDGVSIDACANHCKKEGFMFFGMMYGGACRCSNSYGSKGEDPNGCTMDCFQGTDDFKPLFNIKNIFCTYVQQIAELSLRRVIFWLI